MPLSKQRKNFGWLVSDYFNLLNYPIFTEKSDNLSKENQYTFAVDPSLTKIEIKLAIQELFGVKVESVNTAMQTLKKRRSRGRPSPGKIKLKKAIVTVASGDSIALFQTISSF